MGHISAWFFHENVPHFDKLYKLTKYIFSFSRYQTKCLIEVGLLTSKNILCYFLDWKPFKSDVKCFLLHFEGFFVLKIFKFLSRLFGHVGKTAWLENSLISNFMTSQPGLQTIAIEILPNISQSEGNQTMKSGQLIEYNKRNYFLQTCRKWGRETSFRPLFIFWKNLIWSESKWSAA